MNNMKRRGVAGVSLILSLLLGAVPAAADRVVGTADDDNNSFSTFPIWRGQLDGTARDDDIIGLDGHDILFGGSGNDRLSGGPGRDKLHGESGSDRLQGGYGDRDILIGPNEGSHILAE